MAFSKPVSAEINPVNGQLAGASRRYQKRLSDLNGLYLDESAFALLTASCGEEVAYEVYEYRANENPGDLIFGTSILFPGKVGDEYFMTCGHVHAKSDRPEVYYCQLGTGVMLMETPSGETEPVEMKPQTVVYVAASLDSSHP
jgi:glucose-6-phosphate isomerase